MTKFWFICTILMELLLITCFVIAIITERIEYIQIIWIAAYGFCVIGILLVITALINIRLNVKKKTQNKYQNVTTNNNINNNIESKEKRNKKPIKMHTSIHLSKLTRNITLIIILSLILIFVASLSFITLIIHLLQTMHLNGIERTIYAISPMCSLPSYISFIISITSFNIGLIRWTYQPSSINYCLFCCCYLRYRYKQNSEDDMNDNDDELKLDENTLCYVFCKKCLDSAMRKRQKFIELKQQKIIEIKNKKLENEQNGMDQNDLTIEVDDDDDNKNDNDNDTNQLHVISNKLFIDESIISHKSNTFNRLRASITRGKTQTITDFTPNTTSILQQVGDESVDDEEDERKIKVILYDFDGALSMESRYRYFEHWTDDDVDVISTELLNKLFGDNNRINELNLHFKELNQNNIQIFCISNDNISKINIILNKIGLNEYFNYNNIIGNDHKLINNDKINYKINLFILKLIKLKNINNDELLYVSSNNQNIIYLKNNNFCKTYHVYSNDGLNKNDLKIIQNLTNNYNGCIKLI